MPAAFGAIGTRQVAGTTTCAVAYPSGVAAGHLAVAAVVGWTDANVTHAAESGWTLEGTRGGGTGSEADSNTTDGACHTRELDGSESGSVTFDLGASSGGAAGVMLRYSKDASETWDLAFASGTDDTHGADRSVNADTSFDLAPDDIVVAIVPVDTDAALTITSPAITASGITFGTTTRRTSSGAGNTAGTDGNVEVFDATVSSGSGTAAAALAFTTATSQCGPVLFLRLRAVASGQSAAANPATETDTASSVSRSKTRAATATTETDTAQTLNRAKARPTGIATETDSAVAITQPAAGFHPAVETDTAPGFGRRHTLAVGVAGETGTAQLLGRIKQRLLGVSAESDASQPVGGVAQHQVSPAAETDTSQPVGRTKTRATSSAGETDAGTLLGRLKKRALTAAQESEQATTLGKRHTRLLGAVLEASQALAFVRRKLRALTAALEVDEALQLPTVGAGTPVDDPQLTLDVTQPQLTLDVTNADLELTTTTPVLELTGATP